MASDISSVRYRLLWADDQNEFVEAYKPVVDSLAAELRYVPDAEAAVRACEEYAPDLILADLQMPPGEWGGLWLLENLPSRMRDIPVILVSGRGAMAQCIEALRLGAADYVEKERVSSELAERITRAIKKHRESRPLGGYARVRMLEQRLHANVMGILRAIASRKGQPDIFVGLVPRQVAEKTYARLLDNGGGRQEEFLDLLDLAKIIDELWSEPELRSLEAVLRPRNRAARTEWLSALNEARKIVAHPLRGELSPADLDAVAAAEKIMSAWTAPTPVP